MYKDNPDISEEDMATFCEVLAKLVTQCDGAFMGTLHAMRPSTGEKMEVHLEAHDAVVCEMAKLEFLDHAVKRTMQ